MEIDFNVKKDNKAQTAIIRKVVSGKNTSTVSKQVLEPTVKGQLIEVSIASLVDNPYQPRSNMNEDLLLELAMSIDTNGMLQAITVTPGADNKYIVVFGHRRVAAHKILKRDTIQAVVSEKQSDEELMTKALVENLQREDMSVVDTALSIQSALSNKYYRNQVELAKAIGKDKAYVSKALKVLSLPEKVLEDLIKNKSISDKIILDTIRKIDNVAECERIYFWFIENRPSRAELNAEIAKLNAPETEEKKYAIKSSISGYTIKIPKMDKKAAEKLEAFLKNLL